MTFPKDDLVDYFSDLADTVVDDGSAALNAEMGIELEDYDQNADGKDATVRQLENEIKELEEKNRGLSEWETSARSEIDDLVRSLAEESDLHSLRLLEKTDLILELQARIKVLEETNGELWERQIAARTTIIDVRNELVGSGAAMCSNDVALGECLADQESEVARLRAENRIFDGTLDARTWAGEKVVTLGDLLGDSPRPRRSPFLPQMLLEHQEQTGFPPESRIVALQTPLSQTKDANKMLEHQSSDNHEQKSIDEPQELTDHPKFAELTETIENQAEQIRWAEETIHRMGAEKKEWRDKLANHGTKLASPTQRKEGPKNEPTALQVQIAEQSEWLRKSGAKIRKLLYGQNAIADETLEEIQTSSKVAVELVEAIEKETALREERFTDKLNENENVIAQLETELINKEQRIAGDEIEIASLNAEKYALEVDLTQALHTASEAENMIAALQNMLYVMQKTTSEKDFAMDCLQAQLEYGAQWTIDNDGTVVGLDARVAELESEIAFRNQANSDKADEIVSLKAQLGTQEQENANKKKRVQELEARLIGAMDRGVIQDSKILTLQNQALREMEANTDKEAIIVKLRTDYAQLEQEKTEKDATIAQQEAAYAELDNSWRAVSAEMTDRNLDLKKKFKEQKELFTSDISQKDALIEQINKTSKEEVGSLEHQIRELAKELGHLREESKESDATIAQAEKHYLETCQQRDDLEQRLKSADGVNKQLTAKCKASGIWNQSLRSQVDTLKEQRSTAEALAEQRKEERERIILVLHDHEDTIKRLQVGIKHHCKQRDILNVRAAIAKEKQNDIIACKNLMIENHGLEISTWKFEFERMEHTNGVSRKKQAKILASKEQLVGRLRNKVEKQGCTIDLLKREIEQLRKNWGATKWEEEAGSSDVASVDSRDTDVDSDDDEGSDTDDLEEMQSYDDVQADYENDVDTDGSVKYVDVAVASGGSKEMCSLEDLQKDGEVVTEDEGLGGKGDGEWSVTSEGPAQDDGTVGENFVEIVDEASE
ncbi:hypothetical protein FKW77_009235 [Venturia effusa]|uniref:Uncharacterized protein n=1 Tax=Venturia effusa TaxID=50376 RepID=A0A517LEI9_9PEZI|nr:hypothetical protein FKW77_009235 [Venturia effusa]